MILFLIELSLRGQPRPGLEILYAPGSNSLEPSLSAKLSYETANGNYFELRRNYEQDGTIACSAGRSFSGAGLFSWAITPVAGLVAGKSQGLSVGLNAALEYKRVSFSSCIRNTTCCIKDERGSLFSWSELGYRFVDHLAAGLVMQQTCFDGGGNRWEPGGMVALSFGSWTFPLYLFKSGGEPCTVVAGICYQ